MVGGGSNIKLLENKLKLFEGWRVEHVIKFACECKQADHLVSGKMAVLPLLDVAIVESV